MKTSGIYMIKNDLNKKVYIGQSTNVHIRLLNHKSELKRNKSKNKHLQNSYNKYGKDYFVFEIVCECPPEELNDKEKFFIKKYNSIEYGFNVLEGGEDLEAMQERGKKSVKARLENPGKCLICGHQTRNGFQKYCNNHKGKCANCGKRLEIGRSGCANCISDILIGKNKENIPC